MAGLEVDGLPRVSSDLGLAKSNIETYGYCLLKDALSQGQVSAMRERLVEQAAAERQLGAAYEDGGPDQNWGSFRDESGRVRPGAFTAAQGGVNQRLWMLINKGRVFHEVLFQERVREVIGDYSSRGAIVMITTHHLDEARHCDSVMLMANRLIAAGAPDEILTEERLRQAFGDRLLGDHAGHDHNRPMMLLDDHGHDHYGKDHGHGRRGLGHHGTGHSHGHSRGHDHDHRGRGHHGQQDHGPHAH